MDVIELIGSALGLGFVAGIRLYATVFALGLAVHFHWLHLGAPGSSLEILGHPAVLIASGVAYLFEFFADKIPWVDSIWDSFHTFIRPLGAAILTATVLGPINPALKLTLVILCGGVAFASHSSKMATRILVNHSPEPFSNIALSLFEEIAVPLGVWLSVSHPLIGLALVVGFLAIFAWIAPKVWRNMRFLFTALGACCKKGKQWRPPSASGPPELTGKLPDALRALTWQAAPIPAGHARHVSGNLATGPVLGTRVGASSSIGGLQSSIGYLVARTDTLVFVTRRSFRYRTHSIRIQDVTLAEWRHGLLMNRLTLSTPGGDKIFYVFKDVKTIIVEANHPVYQGTS